MSTNGNGNHDRNLEAIKRTLRERFSPDDIYELMIHVAARDELYHDAVESAVEKVAALDERLQKRPCVLHELGRREGCEAPEDS